MLEGKLIHPGILAALGRAGHGSKVLIADGNYPCKTKLGPNAELVNLNLSPGVVNCTQVLEAIASAIPIEKAEVMQPSDEDKAELGLQAGPPPIWSNFQEEPGIPIELKLLERSSFYKAASDPEVALSIATGDTALFANILLTIGVVMPKE